MRKIICLMVLLGVANPASASLIPYRFDWTGMQLGYMVSGVIVVDDTYAIASTDRFPYTNGIHFLQMTLFSPDNEFIARDTNVINGISQLRTLSVLFDTLKGEFISFDMGAESRYFINSSDICYNDQPCLTYTGPEVYDYGGELVINRIPAPGTFALLSLGLLGLIASRKRTSVPRIK
ncbi:PEP-CTERM sorting domain-containing protein [Aliiglaciecola sp. LCG003]|uniref:PEP-CTERM sorting domain-containing protein n=1 Tax=Aliiglaciecola sp. LCG003 TaxID=3053655 RepID=UPI0025746C69|nr:PEP-CTERM sorting domain-containing protein [Aliiglaciecola sp. LCG003]WJG09734.1 PEP-CTERM sorting domain-containing protein [Aliiglaciecola sp. LCG003]